MSSLGNKLRDARIEKGYTLNTLQQMTKIQKKYLVAIEEGKFNDLPGVFYVRAFVKQYADVVGLNGDELLEEHHEEFDNQNDGDELPDIENIETEELGSRVKARQENIEKDHTEILLSYLPLAFLVGIILMIIFSLVMAISRMNSNENQTIENVTSTSIVSTVEPESVSTTVDESDDDENSNTSDEESVNSNQIRVGNKVLTLVSDESEETVYEVEGNTFDGYTFGAKGAAFVWIGMYEDEVMVVDTTISEGEDFEYTVNPGVSSFRMRFGYPEGGTFTVNGTEVEVNSAYFSETIVFRLKSNTATSESTSEPEVSEAVEETTGYEGPAVLQNREGSE